MKVLELTAGLCAGCVLAYCLLMGMGRVGTVMLGDHAAVTINGVAYAPGSPALAKLRAEGRVP